VPLILKRWQPYTPQHPFICENQPNLFTKMRSATIIVLLLLLLEVAVSCSNSKREALNPAPCITTNVTYSGTIVPLLQQHCYRCHGAAVSATLGAGNTLEGHANIQGYALNSNLLMRVLNHAPASAQMPKNEAKLDDCTIAKFQAWVTAGAPNN
jgi:hypothetical protein